MARCDGTADELLPCDQCRHDTTDSHAIKRKRRQYVHCKMARREGSARVLPEARKGANIYVSSEFIPERARYSSTCTLTVGSAVFHFQLSSYRLFADHSAQELGLFNFRHSVKRQYRSILAGSVI